MTGKQHSRPFFIRDPLKFGDFISHAEAGSANNLKSDDDVGFLVALPGVAAPVTILFSDRGNLRRLPATMDGFSSHALSLINDKNELFYAKWIHFQTQAGHQELHRRKGQRDAAGSIRTIRSGTCSRPSSADITRSGGVRADHAREEAETYPIKTRSTLTKCGLTRSTRFTKSGRNWNSTGIRTTTSRKWTWRPFEPRQCRARMGFSPTKMLQARLIS